jgi:hypothetical protein
VSEEVKKEDKKVFIEKKELTFDEVKNTIYDKLKKGANVLKLRKELLDQNVSHDFINEAQEKSVENLKKKGTFLPDMTAEQLKEMKKKEISASKPAPGAGGKDAAKKKK